MLRDIEGRLYEHCLQANFQLINCELKGMSVDGASLHCIPQERWSMAPSIDILDNLELSSKKERDHNNLKCLYLTCA